MSQGGVRTLIIDNYDSFTFNLYQLIGQVNGEEPVVVRNDQLGWAQLSALGFDNIVISPGPGTPERREDFGVCREAILEAQVPVLGVCLGHQGMGHLYGGTVRHAPTPMHGRLSAIYHDGSPLFHGIPQGFQVVRYHSLIVAPELPACLRRTAWTEDGLVMGLAHRDKPRFGVQFHPESICSEFGAELLKNFRDLTHKTAGGKRPSFHPSARRVSVVPQARTGRDAQLLRTVHSRRVPFDCAQTDRAFAALFGQAEHAFWLDSSRAEPGLARFSYMGAVSADSGALVTYDQRRGEVTVTERGRAQTQRETIYAYLARELSRRRCYADELPFDFNGGFVGYFGYELKADGGCPGRHASAQPDAAFLLAERLLAFDHEAQAAYLVYLGGEGEEAQARAWLDETERRLAALPEIAKAPPTGQPVTLRLQRDRQGYLADIARCQRYITDGETYEVCLTNQIEASPIGDPLPFYLGLRRSNPAPYSSLLRLGELSVLSSSPERFLLIDRQGQVESKPIKGTRPRGRTPEEDQALRQDLADNEKDRSENLMIVDLLRNDLGLVCQVGSVHVPKLMDVESYQTVHQLVSTVRGRLRPGMGAVDCIRAAFPGGSMTGAPKRRTLGIIDELEAGPRGIYSGAIGFLGLNGTADLNIVIRTLVATPERATLGVGGAVVALSDPDGEFEETLVKARALIDAMAARARGAIDPELRQRILGGLRDEGHAAF